MEHETTYRQALGAEIRRRRTEQNISLRRFGTMIGCDYQHLMNIENGKRGVTVDFLVKVAGGLGVQVRDLINF